MARPSLLFVFAPLALLLGTPLGAGVAEARPTLSSSEYNALKRGAKGAAKAGQYAVAASKIRELGRDDSKRAITLMISLVRIPSLEIYDAARDAVAGMRSKEAQAYILDSVGKSGKAVGKMLLIDAMGKRGDAFAGKALGIAVTDRRASVQRAAVGAIQSKKLHQAVGGMIDALEKLEKKDAEGLNASLLREALRMVTGKAMKSAEYYRKWWKVKKRGFRPTTGAEPPAKAGQTAARKRPKFFGSEIRSNRLVFVIDTSGSMNAADPGQPFTGGPPPRKRRTTGGAPGGAAQPKGPAGPSSCTVINTACE